MSVGRWSKAAGRVAGLVLAACASAAVLGGCATQHNEQEVKRAVISYYRSDYRAATRQLVPLADKTNEDFALNNLRLGSSALAIYELPLGESALLKALDVLNATGVNNGGRTAGAFLIDEKMRVWKGEPFERAMAAYYLGVLYYIRRDYHNSRGAFEMALFRLRDYANESDEKKSDAYKEYESSFVAALIMLGRSWQRLGYQDEAIKQFARAAALRPDLRLLADPAFHAQSNVLLIVDVGVGPRRETSFNGSIVGFGPKPEEVGPIVAPAVWVNGKRADIRGSAVPPFDLLAMAQERRWQSIDTVRLIKSSLGKGLVAVGVYQAAKKKPDYGTAAALIIAGALLEASSQADVREWEMLPRTSYIIPLRLPPGTHEVVIETSGGDRGRLVLQGVQAPSDGGDATYYARMMPGERRVEFGGSPLQVLRDSRPEAPRRKNAAAPRRGERVPEEPMPGERFDPFD